MPGRPLVSFVIVGRNDDYMGDYLYRLGTSLSFLAHSAEIAGLLDEIEVLVVDWASARPLATDLPLTPAARRMTTFLEVSAELVQAAHGTPRWLPTCAVNVGVRRAQGEFIFFTDSDCLWSESAVAALDRLLRGDISMPAPLHELLFYVRRYQIPWATVRRRPHLGEWRRLLSLLVAGALPEAPSATCLGGFSAGQLMHRDLWHAARGYDEELDRPWGWSDNDLVLRVSQQHAWLDVSGCGFFGHHMEHWPSAAARSARDASTVNPMIIRNAPVSNGPGWGLGDVEIPAVQSRSEVMPPSGPGCALPLTGRTAAPDWRATPEAADFVRQCKADVESPFGSFDQLAAVAQVALTDLPRNLYWFGTVDAGVLMTLLKACPAIELFLVNPWAEGASDGLSFHPGTLAGFLARARFRGWSRIVQGDPRTALERIDRSSIGDAPIELAWIDPAMPNDVVRELADRLAPGGVILSPVDRDGTSAVERLRNAAPGCVTHVLEGGDLAAATRPITSEGHLDVSGTR